MTKMVSKDYQYLDKRRLRIFYYVKKYGGFGRAKKKLKMEKSGMIEAMNEIESEIGDLFVRDDKGHRTPDELTELGNIINSKMEEENIIEKWEKEPEPKDPFVEKIKNELEKSRKKLEREKKVEFVAPQGIILHYLSNVLPAFREKHPEIKVIGNPEPPEECVRLVISDEVEFYFGPTWVLNYKTPYQDEEILVNKLCGLILITEFPSVIIAKKSEEIDNFFKKAQNNELSRKEIFKRISEYKFSLRNGWSRNKELLRKIFERLGFKLEIEFEKYSTEEIKIDVLNLDLLSIVPKVPNLIDERYATLELKILPKNKYGIIYKKGRKFSKASENFIDFLLIQEGREPYFSKISTKN